MSKAVDIWNATAGVAPYLLKALAILPDTGWSLQFVTKLFFISNLNLILLQTTSKNILLLYGIIASNNFLSYVLDPKLIVFYQNTF